MEISRNPLAPSLNKKAISLLTRLCFRKDDPIKKVDGIFIFSSSHEIKKLASLIERLLLKKISPKVFITGGITYNLLNLNLKTSKNPTEADLLLNAININKFKNVNFFVERESTNTLENVAETLVHPEFKKCKNLLFVFKSHAAGRGYLTLKKYLANVNLWQKTFNTKYAESEKVITRYNWHTFLFGRERVWGEFLRIQKYGLRGDIEYDSVRGLVLKIEKEIK